MFKEDRIMKNKIHAGVLILALSLTVVAACGKVESSDPLAPPPTKAVIKISTAGSFGPDRLIGGITVTAVLPAGVTVKATPDTQNTSILVSDQGVVTASGVTSVNAAAFATVDQPDRRLQIQVYDQNGFGTGEFVTVACDIASGATPTAGNFGLEGFIAKDLNGADIDGLTAGLTVDLQ
jgi:hypothetical protein